MLLELSNLLIQYFLVVFTSSITMVVFLILNNVYLYIFIIKFAQDLSVIVYIYFEIMQNFCIINSTLIFLLGWLNNHVVFK